MKNPLLSLLTRNGGAASRAAPVMVTLSSDSGQRVLALGLRWRAVVTVSSAKEKMALAHKAKATHVATAPLLMGLGQLAPADTPAVTLYSAAMVAAQKTQQQDAVFALLLPDDRVWLASIASGRPSGQEEILDNSLLACQRINELRDGAGLALDVHSDIPDVQGRLSYSFVDLMLLPPPDAAALQPVPKSSLINLPLPVQIAVGGLVVTAIGWQVSDHFANQRRIETQQALAAQEAQHAQNLRQAWQAQLGMALASRFASVNVAPLRHTFNQLPMIWQGWLLQRAKCTASAAAAVAVAVAVAPAGATSQASPDAAPAPSGPSKTWQCVATYNQPQTGVPFAHNKALIAPSGFQIEFLPTREVRLHWRSHTPARALAVSELPAASTHTVGTASVLQANMAQLVSASDIAFAPIKLMPPAVLGAAAVNATPPADIKLPLQSSISFKAPIGVADGMVPHIPADWTEVTLTPAGKTPEIEWIGNLYAS